MRGKGERVLRNAGGAHVERNKSLSRGGLIFSFSSHFGGVRVDKMGTLFSSFCAQPKIALALTSFVTQLIK